MQPGGVLALDLSLTTGWCYGAIKDAAPEFGRWWINGGIHRMGESFVDLQNSLERFLIAHRPSIVVYAMPYAKVQTTARLTIGLAAHAESSCFREGVRVREVVESTARKHVLGRGSFGERGEDRRFIKGSARQGAKDAALAWCRGRGWRVADDNEADACVVWEYARRFLLSRVQWGEVAF